MLTVMKFGGTSVADIDRMENVASIIERAYRSGSKVIAVLSACGDTTDELIEKAKSASPEPDKRELDMLLSCGEQVSVSLCAMILRRRGLDAVSLAGWQAGIRTDDKFGDADIISIDTDRIARELENERIVLLAGFQGVTADGDITTLGRGGSDTTAVYTAAATDADRCVIYKDVDGIYTSDPRKDASAKRYDEISYDDMLALVNGGAQVLHRKCVEFAKEHGVTIYILSSFSDGGGTVVGKA